MWDKFPKTIFLLFCVIFFPAILSAQEVLELDKAVAEALLHNRMIESARLDIEKSNDRLKATRTQYFPQLSISVLASGLLTPVDFTFEKGTFGEYPGIGPIPDRDTSITTPRQLTGLIVGSVQQPLSQLYKIKLSEELAKIAGQEAIEAERERRQSIVNQVKKLYYAILQSQSALGYTQDSIKTLRELDRVTNDYVIQQVALKSEGLQVKAQLAKAEYDALVVSNELATHKEQLNMLMGRDVRVDFQVNQLPEPTRFEADLVAAQQQAMQQNPEIRKARSQFKQAEYDRRIKKAEFIPDLSFNINYLSPLNYEFLPSVVASYGFYFSWDIYDWGRKSHELAQKAKILKQADLAVIETQNKILVGINEQFRKLQEARNLILVTTLARDAAEENLRIVTNKYKERAALFTEVSQAQTSVEETRDQHEKALLAFLSARADFEKSLGEDE